MIEHLFTAGPAPIEYIELLLCRDVYHCTPDQLPDWDTINRHLLMMSWERKLDRKSRL